MVEFDATFLFQAFNFVLLLAILNKIFFQPIIRIQNERREAIENARKSADSRMHELKALREGYHQKLDAARQEAFERISARIAAATQEREAQLNRVNAEMEARLQAAREQIANQEASLKAALNQEVEALAQAIFEQLTAAATGSHNKQEVGIG